MPKSTNLMRRGAIYYAIVNVPADLLDAMDGKRQIWKSLRTADHAEAKRGRARSMALNVRCNAAAAQPYAR